ncbi:DNA polymerase III subunit gamma/tau [uncultured Hymenobacter sp.]|uniref:DNA polymerase III subunit gamma/tau n=1 Tax=uncultured Hymenobacter sp. TaxID=170016 RepID=UPI0035C98E7F
MDNFVVSARKYRPATFRSVVGQQHVTTTLQNAVQSQHLAQAFLFCGPRGVGKTTCARILAKTINCTNLRPDTEACGECASCRAFQENASFNVHELDAASNNSVEDIRTLVEQVRYAPQAGSRYKIYIIDEVHMLSNAAFNAFLKTLEEPPSYAIFILATTERHKIIPTILSRCQVFDFNRIRVEDIREHLRYVAGQEHVTAEDDALHLLAQKADGGLRDALSMFDQMVTFGSNNLTYKEVVQNLHLLDYDYYFRLVEALTAQNLSGALLLLHEVVQNGFDLHNFVVGTAEHLRGLLVCKDPVTVQLLEVSEGLRQRYVQQAQAAPLSFLLSALNLVSQCDQGFKQAKNQRLHVELTLMKLAYLTSAVEFVRDLSPATHAAASTNGEAKKKTSDLNGAAPALNSHVGATSVSAEAAATPALAAPVPTPLAAAKASAVAPSEMAPLAAAIPPRPAVQAAPLPQLPTLNPQSSTFLSAPAPADGPEPLPVASDVEELHPTLSIEPEPPASPLPLPGGRHQLRDTVPHVETGEASMQGHEPAPDQQGPHARPVAFRDAATAAPAYAPSPAPAAPVALPPRLPSLANRIPSLNDLQSHPATAPAPGAAATGVAEPVAEPTGPLAPVDPALLQRVWRELVEERRAQDRMSEYTVLNRPVQANAEHVITLGLDNGIQVDQFNYFRQDFLAELRRRTGHPRLNVQPEIVAAAPTAKKLYTSSDKFEYLAGKFPMLQEMKQRLGLDADF